MEDKNFAKLRFEVQRDEGLRLRLYKDSVGKQTIGYGRNVDDVGISLDEAEYMLTNDLLKAEKECLLAFVWFEQLNDVRKRVLVNMCFNMGIGKLRKFHNTLKAVAHQQYEEAAVNMLASLWAEQVGDRALRLAEMMRTGKDI